MTGRPPTSSPEHACPNCGRAASGGPQRPRALCDTCRASASCEHGRRVFGENTRFTAMGITVRHDDRTECVATIGSGRVWVDGQECRIVATRAGGVAVELPA